MSWPASLVLVNVKGQYYDANGEPEVGSVTLQFSDTLTSSGDNDIVAPYFETKELDATGYVQFLVPASDSTGWTPNTGKYTVKENLSGAVRTYKILVPANTPSATLDLADAPHV